MSAPKSDDNSDTTSTTQQQQQQNRHMKSKLMFSCLKSLSVSERRFIKLAVESMYTKFAQHDLIAFMHVFKQFPTTSSPSN